MQWSSNWRKILACVLLFALAGALLDFICVGILKIIWIMIYGTTYFALAMTIEAVVRKSKFHEFSKIAVFSFVAGAALAHLLFVHRTLHQTYTLKVFTAQPVAFTSDEFPEFLYVTSTPLNAKMADHEAGQTVTMEAEFITDYTCRQNFMIDSIAGVPIHSDAESSWAFRSTKLGTFTTLEMPSMHDNDLPWCKIAFYRLSY